jgi:hypothetical protein
MHPLLTGSDQWKESGNWRDAIGISELAMRYLIPVAENNAVLAHANMSALAEIGAAATYMRDLPSQMRSNSCAELIRLLKNSAAGPSRGLVRGLIGFAVNPLGSSVNLAANQIGKRMVSSDELIVEFLNAVESIVVDRQLEYVWTHASEFPYEEQFDREIGRRAYWYAFVRNESNWLGKFSKDFVLTPDVANEALQKSQLELNALRTNPRQLATLWMSSPLFASNDVIGSINRINETDRVYKKLSKGKTVPEVEQAFTYHSQIIESRQRHIHGYAIRMRWTNS